MDGKQRRLDKVLLCVQGLLHKLETNEGEEIGSTKAATERARQLHSRYRAFMNVDFETILHQESKTEEKGQPTAKGEPQHTKLGGTAANNREQDPAQGAATIISYTRDGNLGKSSHGHNEPRSGSSQGRHY